MPDAPTTEHADGRYHDLDAWGSSEIVAAIIAVQRRSVEAVAAAAPALAQAADAVAALVRGGGRMAYAGAGSSGLLAQMDALELPGTYGIELDRVPVLLAGGREALVAIPSGAEDDEEDARRAVGALRLGPADALVALSASGRTPFALAALREARRRGVLTVGIANNPGTPLLAEAQHPVCLETPPEVIAGSTRMGAGTAQKCALNALSTLLGVRLGHGYAGLMVNMRPENAKLRGRAIAIVAAAAGVPDARASRALDEAATIKTAVLLCSGARDVAEARRRLERNEGDLRAALADAGGN